MKNKEIVAFQSFKIVKLAIPLISNNVFIVLINGILVKIENSTNFSEGGELSELLLGH